MSPPPSLALSLGGCQDQPGSNLASGSHQYSEGLVLGAECSAVAVLKF